MLPIRIGLVTTNFKQADKVSKLLNSMYDYEILTIENYGRSVIQKNLNQFFNKPLVIPDIKNAEQIEFIDHLIFIPDFADVNDFDRKNKPRQFPHWNEAYERYDYKDEDDKLIINLNRVLWESKNSVLAKENHKTDTFMMTYNLKRMYTLFGEIDIKKLAEIHNDIVGKTYLPANKIKNYKKGKK